MAAKRGPSYPLMGLPEAIDRARALYEQDGTARTQQDVAVKAWGYGSLNGTSLRVIAALKHYGLLESADDGVKLTDRATAILLEEAGTEEWRKAVSEAAESPVMFRTIMNDFGGNLPSDGAIVSYLVRKQGFVESAAQNLVESLRETIEFAKQSLPSASEPRAESPSARARGLHERPTGNGEAVRQEFDSAGPTSGGRMQFTWPLSENAVATLTVSRQLDPDDVELLSDYFAVAKRALVKAARTQATAAAASPPPPAVAQAPEDAAE